jgi:hypothetical protein
MFNEKVAVRFGQLAADAEFIISEGGGYFLNGTWGWPSITASDLPSGAQQANFRVGGAAKSITLAVLFISGIILAILSWSRGALSVWIAIGTAVAFAVDGLIDYASPWPAIRSGFSTAQPLQFQLTMAKERPRDVARAGTRRRHRQRVRRRPALHSVGSRQRRALAHSHRGRRRDHDPRLPARAVARPDAAPLVTGVAAAFGALGQGLRHPYSGALIAAVISAVLCLALGWLGTRFLRQFASRQSTSAREIASAASVPTPAG